MNNVLNQLKNVKSELTSEEIEQAIEILFMAKEAIYRNNVNQKKNKIANFEEESSWVTIKTKGRIGKIKIYDVTLPDIELINNIPKQKHPFFVSLAERSYYIITAQGIQLSQHEVAHLHPVIIFDNKSSFSLDIGDTFYINDEEFVVIDQYSAFKKDSLDETCTLFNLYETKNIALYWWLNALVNEAYKRAKAGGDK